MREYADWLEQTLRPRGIRVSRWPLAEPWDIIGIRDAMLALAVEHEDRELVLNVSGGTRPMSIAAYEVFRDLGLPIFYVHPGNDHLVWMVPKQRAAINLADRVKLEAFLQAHGARVEGELQRRGIPAGLRELGAELVQDVERLERPLATLNWLASMAERDLSVTLDERQLHDRDLQQLLDRFALAGALDQQHQRLRFRNEAARRRAEELSIRTCVGRELHGLAETMKRWIG